jgi:hypothetical protein
LVEEKGQAMALGLAVALGVLALAYWYLQGME